MHRFLHAESVRSDSAIMFSVSTRGIKNNHITRRDTLVGVDMLGFSKHVAQGKTTHTQSDEVSVPMQKIDIPSAILQFCNNVEILVDSTFGNNIPYLTSTSDHTHYGKVNSVDNLKYHALETQMKGILRSYTVRGFRTIVIGVDIQFSSLINRNNYDVPFNVVSMEDHVLKI